MDPLLSVLVGAVSRLRDIARDRGQDKKQRRKELNDLWANLEKVRGEYVRFVNGGGTNPDEHSRIIREAQHICNRALHYEEEDCPQECLDVRTDNDADLEEFKKRDEQCRHNLKYISKKRVTDNQVTAEVNKVECEVWGEYQKRNQDALGDAMERIEELKNE